MTVLGASDDDQVRTEFVAENQRGRVRDM